MSWKNAGEPILSDRHKLRYGSYKKNRNKRLPAEGAVGL